MAKMIRMAADRYAQIYRLIKATDPTARVFCCGNFYGVYNSYGWPRFLDQLRFHHSDVKIDGLAIHAYPWGSSISRGNTGYQAVAWFISIGADPLETNLFVKPAPQPRRRR